MYPQLQMYLPVAIQSIGLSSPDDCDDDAPGRRRVFLVSRSDAHARQLPFERLLVRPGSRDKTAGLEARGAQVVEGAIGPDGGSALASLCEAATTVISAVQGGPEMIIDGQVQLLRAARDAIYSR